MGKKLEDAIRYAKCCSAAFNAPNIASILFQELGYYHITQIDNVDTSTTAYLLTNAKETVLVFKASKEPKDWVTNFTFLLTGITEGKCHSGFLSAYNSVDGRVVSTLTNALYKDKPLVLCGHSLGGALAQVGALLLNEDFPINSVYTFGAPRAFNKKAAKSFDSSIDCIRFEVAGDAIARMPKPFMGYRHAGNHVYFDSKGRPHIDPSKSFQWYSNVLDIIDELLTATWKDWEDHKISLYIKRLIEWQKTKTYLS